jgi:hypothetical protein
MNRLNSSAFVRSLAADGETLLDASCFTAVDNVVARNAGRWGMVLCIPSLTLVQWQPRGMCRDKLNWK